MTKSTREKRKEILEILEEMIEVLKDNVGAWGEKDFSIGRAVHKIRALIEKEKDQFRKDLITKIDASMIFEGEEWIRVEEVIKLIKE